MSDCQWERFKATAAPMASQQRQIQFCKCKLCFAARAYRGLPNAGPGPISDRTAVLAWKPEPPPSETEGSTHDD